jgi:5S rRNA maturation endonuclease (ribonuclease M5)
MKRFTRSNHCPICTGYDGQERGRAKRCYGFLSDDGQWAHCTREEYAGSLPRTSSDTFAHLLYGDCRCGTVHNPELEVAGAKPGTKTSAVTEYDYIDEHGELLFQVCRTNPKRFFQRRPDGQGGWINKLEDVRRVLYRLPELLEADPSATVFVCEGEKDADALRKLGLVATTNAGGAGKWRDDYNEHLRGRNVVILPDNDEPGRKHAEEVSKSLGGVAASVKVVALPRLPEKGDVSDWLKAGGSAGQLESLTKEAAPQEASSSNSSNSSNSHVQTGKAGGVTPLAFPKLDRSKALTGLAGDIVRAIEPHSEADPTALLVQLLVAFGNVAGRSAHFLAEADRHYTNLFAVVVGDSSRGRKGSSLSYIRRLIEEVDPELVHCITGGLTSGEGLVHHVRDDSDVVVPGAVRRSKHALVVESEFASVLQAQSRKGSTLSTFIRQAWDTGDLAVMRRDSPDRATNAHISIIAHITGDELRRCLDSTDTVNGYANRFLWVSSRRSKKLPEGGHFNLKNSTPLVSHLRAAIRFASMVREMRRDDEARALWREIYNRLDEELPNGRLEAILSRAEAQIMRLACVYALLDCSPLVKRVHLESAKAVWDYCVASARYIFGQVLSKKAQKFLDLLTEAGTAGISKSELLRRNGGRSDGLNEALAELAGAGYAFRLEIPTAGRDEERWFAAPGETAGDENDEFDDLGPQVTSEPEGGGTHETGSNPPDNSDSDPDDTADALLERAAIMEYDGHIPGEEAERLATLEFFGLGGAKSNSPVRVSEMFGPNNSASVGAQEAEGVTDF